MPMSPRIKAKKGRFGSAGLAPVVTIGDHTVNTGSAGSPVVPVYTLDIAGVAIDDLGGNISASIIWTSSIDGSLGTGASLSGASLSAGTHVITASATDGSPGKTGTDTITIVVG